MREIILASTSPQRRDILERTGLPFIVEDSGYVEDMRLPLSPTDLVQHLAEGKAAAVAARHPQALVIGADTIVVCGGEVFGKPVHATQARHMLEKLSGTSHSIFTGFVIIDGASGRRLVRTVETHVRFKQLSAHDIEAYIGTGESLGKAGGYAFQGEGARLVESIEGDPDNVVGLPLQALREELAKCGVEV